MLSFEPLLTFLSIHFQAEPKGAGVYLGKGIPVMVGSWVADVKVNVNGYSTVVKHVFKATR